MRRNLIARMTRGETLFPDILGYEETVLPQVQNAILSRHDILFLGLRLRFARPKRQSCRFVLGMKGEVAAALLPLVISPSGGVFLRKLFF